MHKLFVAVFFISIFLGSVFIAQNVEAVSQDVVISQVQVGASGSATSEFIELFNNSDKDIEITNWCLYYAAATNKDTFGSKMTCFTTDNISLHLFVPAKSYIFAISKELSSLSPDLKSDFKFSSTLSGTAGHIRLVDSANREIDKLGWGTSALVPEGQPAIVPSAGKVLARKSLSQHVLQDTDNNNLDFDLSVAKTSYDYGAIYEAQDLCQNIIGVQTEIPPGLVADDVGGCITPPVDQCSNIDGMQAAVPAGFLLDSNGDCIKDQCSNIDGLQSAIPEGFFWVADIGCKAKPLQLKISELLPNADGSDEGNEFIEIFNPNDAAVDLLYYMLFVGSDEHFYSFPAGAVIEPGQYLKFSNDDIKFTLLNSGSFVRLKYIGDFLIDEASYVNPPEGQSWSLVNGVWQYTNQLTPAAVNLPMLVEADVAVVKTASTLKPCKDGQYRSEETGRCRNIITDVADLVPCAEGQERNPATNRCRSTTIVLGDSDLKPCDPGQERNPETNRCRNIASSDIPKADYAPEQTGAPQTDYTSWFILGGIGLMAVGYGVWEWRFELSKLFKNVLAFLRRRK